MLLLVQVTTYRAIQYERRESVIVQNNRTCSDAGIWESPAGARLRVGSRTVTDTCMSRGASDTTSFVRAYLLDFAKAGEVVDTTSLELEMLSAYSAAIAVQVNVSGTIDQPSSEPSSTLLLGNQIW